MISLFRRKPVEFDQSGRYRQRVSRGLDRRREEGGRGWGAEAYRVR